MFDELDKYLQANLSPELTINPVYGKNTSVFNLRYNNQSVSTALNLDKRPIKSDFFILFNWDSEFDDKPYLNAFTLKEVNKESFLEYLNSEILYFDDLLNVAQNYRVINNTEDNLKSTAEIQLGKINETAIRGVAELLIRLEQENNMMNFKFKIDSFQHNSFQCYCYNRAYSEEFLIYLQTRIKQFVEYLVNRTNTSIPFDFQKNPIIGPSNYTVNEIYLGEESVFVPSHYISYGKYSYISLSADSFGGYRYVKSVTEVYGPDFSMQNQYLGGPPDHFVQWPVAAGGYYYNADYPDVYFGAILEQSDITTTDGGDQYIGPSVSTPYNTNPFQCYSYRDLLNLSSLSSGVEEFSTFPEIGIPTGGIFTMSVSSLRRWTSFWPDMFGRHAVRLLTNSPPYDRVFFGGSKIRRRIVYHEAYISPNYTLSSNPPTNPAEDSNPTKSRNGLNFKRSFYFYEKAIKNELNIFSHFLDHYSPFKNSVFSFLVGNSLKIGNSEILNYSKTFHALSYVHTYCYVVPFILNARELYEAYSKFSDMPINFYSKDIFNTAMAYLIVSYKSPWDLDTSHTPPYIYSYPIYPYSDFFYNWIEENNCPKFRKQSQFVVTLIINNIDKCFAKKLPYLDKKLKKPKMFLNNLYKLNLVLANHNFLSEDQLNNITEGEFRVVYYKSDFFGEELLNNIKNFMKMNQVNIDDFEQLCYQLIYKIFAAMKKWIFTIDLNLSETDFSEKINEIHSGYKPYIKNIYRKAKKLNREVNELNTVSIPLKWIDDVCLLENLPKFLTHKPMILKDKLNRTFNEYYLT